MDSDFLQESLKRKFIEEVFQKPIFCRKLVVKSVKFVENLRKTDFPVFTRVIKASCLFMEHIFNLIESTLVGRLFEVYENKVTVINIV